MTWEETGIAAPTVFVVPSGPGCPMGTISSSTDPDGSFTVTAGDRSNRLVLTVSPAVPVHSFRLIHPCPSSPL